VLKLENVTKEYQNDGERVRALDDVSLEVQEGEFLALVGRSGCGKSTLLNLAGAMDFPSAGRVFIDGRCTSGLNDAALTELRRTRIGFVFQSFQLLYTLTAVENVELPLLLGGEAGARRTALAKLGELEMKDLAGRLVHQLSGGQMQRVAIARSLVHSPRLLLADEPTGNLDTATGNLILDLLRRVNQSHGTTIVMATHSIESAAVAGALARLRDGRLDEVRCR
jgi:ABC-type lipoprotein export system ATPase subunit